MTRRSDAPHKLHIYFLRPNLEGLLRTIRECDPSLLPDAMTSALAKDLNQRDVVLREVKKEHLLHVRTCMSARQPGIAALADRLAEVIQGAAAA